MAKPSRRKEEQFYVAEFCCSAKEVGSSQTPNNAQAASACCLQLAVSVAKASTTEEPDAGKLHVRDCGGGTR